MTRVRRVNVFSSLLALASYEGGDLHPWGTAFVVGSGGLAMTAFHVLEEVPHDSNVVGFQVVDRGRNPLQWAVTAMHGRPTPYLVTVGDGLVAERGTAPSDASRIRRPLDLAFLRLQPLPPAVPPMEDHRDWFFELDAAPPKVGDRLCAYGFAEHDWKKTGSLDWRIEHSFKKVEGVVTEVYPELRDRAAMPFPCFQMEGDFLAGMSGGPVFNARDRVCGVISRSGLGVSFASSLWPALAIQVAGKPLSDLAHDGTLRFWNYWSVQLIRRDGEPPRAWFNHDLLKD